MDWLDGFGIFYIIGGWEGMGYGFIGFFVLLGTLIGMIAHQLVKISRKSYV
ncbi:YesK family protein [Bacillus thuringiensis]|uniref:YesK family protein n=1 Tax=Bacillus thuringiensis TaxID=1428 RepID=UPI002FFF0DC0